MSDETTVGPISIELVMQNVQKVIGDFQNMSARLTAIDERLKKKEVSEAEKAAKQKLKVAEQEEKDKQKLADKTAAEMKRVEEKKTRLAEVESKKRQAIADRESKAISKTFMSGLNAINPNNMINHVMSRASRMITYGLMIGGGLDVQQAVSHQLTMQKLAAKVAVSSRVPGKMENQVTPGEALEQSRELSKNLNIDETDILGALHSLIAKTGLGKQSFNIMSDVARISKAEGVDINELASAVGIAMAQNPELANDRKQLNMLMRELVAQGKQGSVELADMATVLPIVMAQAGKFEGKQGDNQEKLAALLQVAIKATGSPEQAGVAIKNIASDVVRHQKTFTAKGIDIFGAAGKIKDINVLLAETFQKTHGNVFALKGLFGERASPVINALNPVFEQAEKEKRGSGGVAVANYLNDLDRLRVTEQQVDADLKTIQDSEKLDKAFKDLNRSLGEKLTPKLLELIPRIQALVPAFGKLVDAVVNMWDAIGNHPWETAFAGLAIKLSAGIVGAVLPPLITGALSMSAALGPLVIAAGAAAVALMMLNNSFNEAKLQQDLKNHVNAGKTDAERFALNADKAEVEAKKKEQDAKVAKGIVAAHGAKATKEEKDDADRKEEEATDARRHAELEKQRQNESVSLTQVSLSKAMERKKQDEEDLKIAKSRSMTEGTGRVKTIQEDIERQNAIIAYGNAYFGETAPPAAPEDENLIGNVPGSNTFRSPAVKPVTPVSVNPAAVTTAVKNVLMTQLGPHMFTIAPPKPEEMKMQPMDSDKNKKTGMEIGDALVQQVKKQGGLPVQTTKAGSVDTHPPVPGRGEKGAIHKEP